VSTSGAKCTATASVYDASRDENNIYVHSNQPDQEAEVQENPEPPGYKTGPYHGGPQPLPHGPI
jgi:hypothetical protein